MRNKSLIFLCLVSFFLSGCFFLPEGLKTLKSVSDSQDEIEVYLIKQTRLFDELLNDLNQETLEPGISKNKFIYTYGEPILFKEVDNPSGGLMLFYRHPTEYFKSDRVYFYFDQEERLVRWEYKPKK